MDAFAFQRETQADTPEVFIAPRQSGIAGGVLELDNKLLGECIRVKAKRIVVNRASCYRFIAFVYDCGDNFNLRFCDFVIYLLSKLNRCL